MSLIARRIISNRNLIKCSINSVKVLSIKQTILSKITSTPHYSFNVLKLNYYSTDTNGNVELKAKFDKLVKDKKIVVFMKGF